MGRPRTATTPRLRLRRTRSCTSRRTLRFRVHGRRGRRDDQLHAGGDQPGQCGDCQCGGGRSVHDQRGAGSERHLQYRRHRSGQSAGCRRDLAVHGQPHGDAGRARRRDSHRQHGDGDGRWGVPGQRRRLGCGCAEQDPAHREGRFGSGCTADVAGETISYTLAVTNQGNAAIANVVVSDPFTTNEAPVLSGTFNIGDSDQDNLLDIGETWQYTASNTVTQAELDAGTSIVNTATVTGTGATPDSDDATVAVAQGTILHIEKDATVADGTANSTSDVINYTLAVTNQGNAAIANVVVDDPFTTNEAPVLNGTFNTGDTDQDSLLDVGETWQYTASHTVTQAGLDAGTAIVNTATVTGDGATPDSDDASVAVAQGTILHIEKDATVADGTANSTSDVINYTLAVTNQGNAAIANVVVDDPFTTNEAPVLSGTFNAGDTNQDNLLDVGETWQYTASHTVTQAELDAGTAIVNTATVTGDGATPDSDDASVAVAQGTILHIEKDATVADGTANSTSDVINYTLAVTNQGNAAIANVVVDDPFTTNEAPVLSGTFNTGDTDQDSLLDVGETWQYTASHTVTQAGLDAGTAIVNTATVTGDGATPDSDDASVAVAQG